MKNKYVAVTGGFKTVDNPICVARFIKEHLPESYSKEHGWIVDRDMDEFVFGYDIWNHEEITEEQANEIIKKHFS